MAMEPIYFEDLVPTPGSQEPGVCGSEDLLSPGARLPRGSPSPGSSPQQQDSVSPCGSASDPDLGLDSVRGGPAGRALGGLEGDFESAICVRDFSFELSQDLLERGAQAHSALKGPSRSATGPDEGTVRKMALATVE